MSRLIAIRSSNQSGAALFVSMMILILLTMLALSTSQVTALQEKMASAYWADTRAFERSEMALRAQERLVRQEAELGLCNSDGVQLPDWVVDAPTGPGTHVMAIRGQVARGSGVESSIEVGTALGSTDCAYFRVSAADADVDTTVSDASSWSVVQSVFVP
ncbi:MAG: PilX N-terminal domain-containing pilus assembly protein [Lysobacteraceae bacterium]